MPLSNEDLTAAARAVREHAYAPYSNYRVGAAVQDEEGRIFTGVNVENVSFGATLCAERAAIGAMAAAGGRLIRTIAVATADGGTPCGICLQFIREFVPNPDEALIISTDERRNEKVWRLSDLFPIAFDSKCVGRTE